MPPSLKSKLQRTVLPIAKLVPSPYNPRTISAEALDGLKASIERFGLVQEIVVNRRNMRIVGGHQRVVAAKQSGEKDVPVTLVDLDEDDEKRLNITLNNPHVAGEFTEDLQALLRALADKDEESFSDLLLDRLLDMADQELPPDIDAVPPVPKKVITKPGDLWILGKHRLLCGDAMHLPDIKKLTGDRKIDLLFTDPPYGINAVKVSGKSLGSIGGAKAFGSTHGRSKSAFLKSAILPTLYEPIIGDTGTETARKSYVACQEFGLENFIIFGGNYFTDFLRPSRCWVIWDKQTAGNFADVEMAWTSFDKPAKLYSFLWSGLCREGNRATELVGRVHPTQKPVGLFINIFRDFPGDAVLDLFGGSGSTLIACEQSGRTCFMMELSPAYCDVIVKRYEDLTQQKAHVNAL